MKVLVQFFARARDLAGVENEAFTLPPDSTVAQLRQAINLRHPALLPLSSSLMFAIDTAYADDSAALAEGSNLACFRQSVAVSLARRGRLTRSISRSLGDFVEIGPRRLTQLTDRSVCFFRLRRSVATSNACELGDDC